MKDFIKTMDNLPKLIKLIFALPFLDIIWNVTRLFKSIIKQNLIGIIFAIILIVPGIAFMWLVDIICVLLYDKVLWIE
ncbi:MAG: hypothetical protein IJR66_01265 [Clostridia bacterium]|nr:hypothetical protein [Clostridia bacterium]